MSTPVATAPVADERPQQRRHETPSPLPGGRRVAALDVLRGLAIVGTLLTNIGMWVYISDSYYEESPGWRHVDTFVGLITDGKYIGLLTIMFGIGLEIQRQAAVRKGEPWLGAYPWRALLLVLDGLLNYIFIFDFDVLMGYGLTGLTMCFVFATTERFQKWFLAFGLAVHLAFLGWMSRIWTWFSPAFDGANGITPSEADYVLMEKAPSTLTPAQLARVAEIYDVPPSDYARMWQQMQTEIATEQHQSYVDVVQSRLDHFWAGRGEIPIMFTMGLGLFLVGAFLYRAGIFEPSGRKLRFRVMALSFGIGLPLDWVTRLWFSDYTGTFNRYLTSAMVSVGLLALVAHFYADGRRPGRIGRALSLVGKMALTCYLMQNLLGLLLFAEYGPLRLATYWPAGWPPIQVYAAWALITAIMIGFSAVWLRFFDRGPVELLWHWSYDVLTTHIPTRWEPRVKRADAARVEVARLETAGR